MVKSKNQYTLHLMLLIPVILVLIYAYLPMVGILMAFQNYVPSKEGFFYALFHNEWVGLDIFKLMFSLPDTGEVIWNTIFISFMKIVAKIIFPLIFALLLNEIVNKTFKKLVQTITFIPFFLSWVVLGGILLQIFSPRTGIVNDMIVFFGGEPIYFWGDPKLFPYMIVLTDLWKDIGYNTIIFLAALTAIDPTFYEAAIMDGAGRWKQTIYLTIPNISSIVALVGILSLGSIMSAGLDQILMLYGPSVYSTGDVIDTYTYRMGLGTGQYSLATAVGLFKSVVSLILITSANWLATKYTEYRIF